MIEKKYIVVVNVLDTDNYVCCNSHEFETLQEAEDFAFEWALEEIGNYSNYKHDDEFDIIHRTDTTINTDELKAKVATNKEELRLKKEEDRRIVDELMQAEILKKEKAEYERLKEKFEPGTFKFNGG